MSPLTVCTLALSLSCSLGLRSQRAKAGSCAAYGCGAFNWDRECQCNDACVHYNNCCSDYSTFCSSCARYGCNSSYSSGKKCQCNWNCQNFNNCCDDFEELCSNPPTPVPTPAPTFAPTPVPTPYPTAGPGPSPSPSPEAEAYWAGVDLNSRSAIQQKLVNATRLSYKALWTTYKTAWVDLPGQCSGKIFDVYSAKCWTKGSGQCGSYRKEGDCYNREHSWPKSWWGRQSGPAYSDMFHVVPSDGFVNGKRSSWPFGEVPFPTYTSSEGNKVGPCATAGYSSATCFEPTDKVKGFMARSHLYVTTRYSGSFDCCSGAAQINGELKSWTIDLMLGWNRAFPPEAWELEVNNRIQVSQRNRNPFIDFPLLADSLFR